MKRPSGSWREQVSQLLDEVRGLRADITAAAQAMTGTTPIGDLPAVLLIDDIARLYRQHAETVRKKCRQGTFRPLPFEHRPWRWRRVDVLDDLERHGPARVRRRNLGPKSY